MSKFCFKCGTTMEDDAPVCPRCAASFGYTPTSQAEQSAPTAQIPEQQSAEQPPAVQKAKKEATRKPVLIGIICAVAFTLIVSCCLLFIFLNPRYTSETDNVLYVYHRYLNSYTIMYPIYDGELIGDPIKMKNSDSTTPNCDGSAYLELTSDGQLYLVLPQKIQPLLSGVERASFSKDGRSVYILCDSAPYTLKRYDIDAHDFSIVATGLSSTYQALDNNQVVYLAYSRQSTRELFITDGTNSRKLMDIKGDLIFVSPNCERIFVRERPGLSKYEYVCYSANGDREVLLSTNSYNGQTFFNRDYTQMLYSSYNDGSYICQIGKEPVKISDSFAEPIYAHGSDHYTISVDNFFGQIYYTSIDRNVGAWLIQPDPSQNIQLVKSSGIIETDVTGEYLYYMVRNGRDMELRIAKISDMADASKNSVLLTNDTADFDMDLITHRFTSDGETLYYIFEDSLYAVHGRQGGTPKCIATGLDSRFIRLSANDFVYYNADGDLYAYDGKQTTLVLQDVKNFSVGDYPIAETADGIYIINDGEKPQLLVSLP